MICDDFCSPARSQAEYIWEHCKPESGFQDLTPEQRKDQLVAFDNSVILGSFRAQLCAAESRTPNLRLKINAPRTCAPESGSSQA